MSIDNLPTPILPDSVVERAGNLYEILRPTQPFLSFVNEYFTPNYQPTKGPEPYNNPEDIARD